MIPGQLSSEAMAGLVSEEFYGKNEPDDQDRPTIERFYILGNQALQDVCTELGWNWCYREGTFNTVVNQTDPYSLDEKVRELLWLTLPAYQVRLPKMQVRDDKVSYPGQYQGMGAGQPAFYVPAPPTDAPDNEMRIYLGPGPADQIYTLKYGYISLSANLTFAADEYPILPSQWQDLWRMRWLMQLYRFAGPGSADKLKMAQAAYQDAYRRAWTSDTDENDSVQRWRDLWAENAAWPGRNVGYYLFGQW